MLSNAITRVILQESIAFDRMTESKINVFIVFLKGEIKFHYFTWTINTFIFSFILGLLKLTLSVINKSDFKNFPEGVMSIKITDK